MAHWSRKKKLEQSGHEGFRGGEERGFRTPLVNGFLNKTQKPVHEAGARKRLK